MFVSMTARGYPLKIMSDLLMYIIVLFEDNKHDDDDDDDAG